MSVVADSQSGDVETTESLRLELQKAQEKLVEWKAKTKVGVDKLREQVVELTNHLETSKAANAKLKNELAALEAKKSVGTPSGTASSEVVSSGYSGSIGRASEDNNGVHPLLFAWCSAVVDQLLDSRSTLALEASSVAAQCAAAQASAAIITSGTDIQQSFDKYKKRAEQSMKLAAKQQEILVAESKELRSALDQSLDEMKNRDKAIEQRNLALTSLEKQLDTALYTIDTLRADMAERQLHNSGDLRHQQNLVSVEEVKVEVERIQKEFGDREQMIHQLHRDEVERMLRSHEEELRILEDDLREAYEQELALANASRQPKPAAVDDDEAYVSLLKERDALLSKIKERDQHIASLEQRVASLCNMTATASRSDDISPAALQRRIAELEKQVEMLGEQLWAANNVVLESKASKRTETANGTKKGPEAQQAYLKSIVIKLVCEKSDDVRANLIPVLTTLLQLEPDDLRTIFMANPSWIK